MKLFSLLQLLSLLREQLKISLLWSIRFKLKLAVILLLASKLSFDSEMDSFAGENILILTSSSSVGHD